MHSKLLVFSEKVEAAIQAGRPITALESTIISHGMPWPKNLETALLLEKEVEKGGSTPATIAILNGKICIGLSRKDLEMLAQADDVAKVSRRDLPVVLAQGGNGATTVAATMICAKMAGIKVFATGGIGGVHRGGELSLDISADLLELAQTEVAVVCAGAKAILDLGRTLEFLETYGVPVIGVRTNIFPAFYTRNSGYTTHARAENPQDIAAILHTKWAMGLGGGAVIANPIPEQWAMDDYLVGQAIEKALQEADRQGVVGKDITPFLLNRMEKLTGGESLASNIELVRNNAQLAASISLALNQLGKV